MMRKFLCLSMAAVLWIGVAWSAQGIDSWEKVSIKAGPTEPGEGLSLAWIEALSYPKVLKEERMLFLEVRVASPVKEIKATFDFNSDKVKLTSSDGMSWSGNYKIPASVSDGVHVVRYQITKGRGSVQRTLEFFVEKPEQAIKKAPDVSRGETIQSSGWPITITSSCTAYSGTTARALDAGQRMTGLSKVPWYKVLFDDGKEGWVPASYVKEPTEDFYCLGYEAYKAQNYALAAERYRNAVTVNSSFIKGYVWLAKSYAALDDLDSASDAIQSALKIDGRNMDARVIAGVLAQKYFKTAHEKFAAERYHEAVANFQKAIELKSNSVSSWIEMGKSLVKLGLADEARSAWREGLKFEPENQELHALLKMDRDLDLAAVPEEVKAPIPQASKGKNAVAPALADDSLKIVKDEKTNKGTKIESAIKSVVSLTKSLGTPVAEKGWQIKKQGEKFLVKYLCEQGSGALESFEWLVDVDTRQALPHNDNARLLMSRW